MNNRSFIVLWFLLVGIFPLLAQEDPLVSEWESAYEKAYTEVRKVQGLPPLSIPVVQAQEQILRQGFLTSSDPSEAGKRAATFIFQFEKNLRSGKDFQECRALLSQSLRISMNKSGAMETGRGLEQVRRQFAKTSSQGGRNTSGPKNTGITGTPKGPRTSGSPGEI